MKYMRKPRELYSVVQWDGSAGTANSFIGERYGMDWQYLKDNCDIIVYPDCEYPAFKVKVGEYLGKTIRHEDDEQPVYKMNKEDFDCLMEYQE